MDLLNILSENLVIILATVGIMAFLVSVITEVTKELGFLAKIPTDLQVIVLSIVLCLCSYFAYVSYMSLSIQWFYIIACIVASFIVAFVAMYGWDKLITLYNRFKK